jgi:hypothetical protein
VIIPQEPERIREMVMSRITKQGDCWIWPHQREDGYGMVSVDGQRWRIHRLVYHHLVTPLSKSVVVHHRCGTRACCNPDHLQATSAHANNAEMMARQALLATIKVLEDEIHTLLEEVLSLSAAVANQPEGDLDE